MLKQVQVAADVLLEAQLVHLPTQAHHRRVDGDVVPLGVVAPLQDVDLRICGRHRRGRHRWGRSVAEVPHPPVDSVFQQLGEKGGVAAHAQPEDELVILNADGELFGGDLGLDVPLPVLARLGHQGHQVHLLRLLCAVGPQPGVLWVGEDQIEEVQAETAQQGLELVVLEGPAEGHHGRLDALGTPGVVGAVSADHEVPRVVEAVAPQPGVCGVGQEDAKHLDVVADARHKLLLEVLGAQGHHARVHSARCGPVLVHAQELFETAVGPGHAPECGGGGGGVAGGGGGGGGRGGLLLRPQRVFWAQGLLAAGGFIQEGIQQGADGVAAVPPHLPDLLGGEPAQCPAEG
ncbi:hypothetical protein AALO_G00268820 [Alosa alosa]|uniref:Uncharacterized protein n=1 Tax=Alosa alosa TaxID=278164 RepID=A0AAV6FPW2_9TELE|nr:hypothetical protein AALO_G00268820 [Alosa alosa]